MFADIALFSYGRGDLPQAVPGPCAAWESAVRHGRGKDALTLAARLILMAPGVSEAQRNPKGRHRAVRRPMAQ